MNNRARSLYIFLASLSLTILLALSSPTAHAQNYTEKTEYNFGTNYQDGPYYNHDASGGGGAMINVGGIFYGASLGGGTFGAGTIYTYNPVTHAESIIYSFQGVIAGNQDGYMPQGSLVEVDVNGHPTLFGTAVYGGTYASSTWYDGFGMVFSYDLVTGKEKIIHSFSGANGEGSSPRCTLVAVGNTLYGTTNDELLANNTRGTGTLFSINTDGSGYKTLYRFGITAGDGVDPSGNLALINGKLYGIADEGSNGDGAIFSFDPTTNAEKVVYSFQGSGTGDGNEPERNLIVIGSVLYGSTTKGGLYTSQNVPDGYGTIFSFDTTTNVEKAIYSFQSDQGRSDYEPIAIYVNMNGILFGVTYQRGSDGSGSVFAINTDGTGYQTLYNFGSYPNDGGEPSCLFALNGEMYGLTATGGTNDFDGTIFSLTPPIMTAPVAHNDACTVKCNTTRINAAPGVLANDSSGGSSLLTATLTNNVAHGSLILHQDGSFTYTPKIGYLGADSFTYRVANPEFQGSTATVSLTVVPTTPTANNDIYEGTYNTALTLGSPGVLNNDNNGGSNPVTAALVKTTSHGTLTLKSNGSFTYIPATGYVGTDSFTYQASNPIGQGTVGTVTLIVKPTTPTAHNDGATIAHNKARTFAAPGILANDDNGGSSPMTAALVSNVTHGTLTLGSDGSFTYTPNTGYSGTDTFTYRVSNHVGQGTVGTVTLTVQ